MSMLKLSCLALFVVSCAALPLQEPLNDEVLRAVVKNVQPNDAKLNGSNSPAMPMMMEQSRQAFYPNSQGLGHYNLGQISMSVPHYPNGWPLQMNQAPVWNNMQFKNEEHTDARTLGHLRPSLYSQYQTISPQTYAYPVAAPVAQAYHYQPYEYSTPLVSGSGHNPIWSTYSSLYKNAAEDEKFRQFWNTMPSEKYISPIQPSVSYASKYLFERPTSTFGRIEGISQPQMYQSMPMLVRKEAPAQFQSRDAGSADVQFVPRDVMVDGQYQMHIPPNYLLEKLQTLPASPMTAVPQHEMFAQPQMSRAAEESRPMAMELAPSMFQNQAYSFKNVDTNQQIQDPYVTPQDQVIMEPYVVPESGHVQSSRAAEEMTATWPNYQQQLRIAEIQGYNNGINKFAAQIEALSEHYARQREMMLSNNKQYPWDDNQFPLEGKSSESTLSHKENLINQTKEVMKSIQQLKEAEEKRQNSERIAETSKLTNKDANQSKQPDVTNTPVKN